MHTIKYVFSGYTGLDMFYSFLPERTQAKILAKRLLKTTYKGVDIKGLAGETAFVIQMPLAAYRVTSFDGKTIKVLQTAVEGQ